LQRTLNVRFTPQFLRALHLELFTKPSFKWFLLNEKNEKGGKNGAPGDLKPRFTLKRKKPPFD